MVALVFSLSFVVQIANLVSLAGPAGEELLPLLRIHLWIRHRPWEPSNYWLYFTVLSTFIPTVVHFAMAGMAMVPGTRGLWLRSAEDAAVLEAPKPGRERLWLLTLRLTGHVLLGSFLGIAVFLLGPTTAISAFIDITDGLVGVAEAGKDTADHLALWWTTGCGLDGALRCAPK